MKVSDCRGRIEIREIHLTSGTKTYNYCGVGSQKPIN
jgi:hypothetical protein